MEISPTKISINLSCPKCNEEIKVMPILCYFYLETYDDENNKETCKFYVTCNKCKTEIESSWRY